MLTMQQRRLLLRSMAAATGASSRASVRSMAILAVPPSPCPPFPGSSPSFPNSWARSTAWREQKRGLVINPKNKRVGAAYLQHPHEAPEVTEKQDFFFRKHGQHKVKRMSNVGSNFAMLNRPKANHALDLSMIRDLKRIYLETKLSPTLDLVMVFGGNEKAFCAGGDVKYLAQQGIQPMGKRAPQMKFFGEEYKLNYLIANMQPKISVAYIDGFAGVYLALTGKQINTIETCNLGISTHFVSNCHIGLLQKRIETTTSFVSPEAFELNLDVYMRDDEYKPLLPTGEDRISPHLPVIEKIFGMDKIDDMKSALKDLRGQGNEHSQWAEETLSLLNAASPTSLDVTLEQMKRGRECKDLLECLRMEYRMARRFLANPDFFEGVRSILIDKDRNPKWAPRATPEQVEEYFQPLTSEPELDG